jgi:hypothetical protein
VPTESKVGGCQGEIPILRVRLIGRHSGEPGEHAGLLIAAEPDDHLENRVAITKQRAPDRLSATRHHTVGREPAAGLLMRHHGVKQRLDPVKVTPPVRPWRRAG